MSQDFYNCDICGGIFGDYGEYYRCDECGLMLCCDNCAEDAGYDFCEDKDGNETDGICGSCRGELERSIPDKELLDFALKELNVSREQLEKLYREK